MRPGQSQERSSANFPSELTERNQWVAWKSVVRAGAEKPTKQPLDPKCNRLASTTDPQTWSSFDGALAKWKRGEADGIGFVFTADDPFVGVDLDGCRDRVTGEIEVWAKAIVELLDSYSEISPTGTGLHVICRGELPPGRRRRGKIEMYSDGRYFTMTGAVLEAQSTDVPERTDALALLHDSVFGAPGIPHEGTRQTSSSHRLEDEELLARASSARNGNRFSALWSGNMSGNASASEADLALCNLLAFWTGGDPYQIDRLFRRSGLMRSKWDEARGERTYGSMTVQKAVANTVERFAGGPTIPEHGSAKAKPDPSMFPLTDAGNAELFAALFGANVRYDHRRGRWLLWRDHHWREDSDGEIFRLAKSATRIRYQSAKEIDDTERKQRVAKWAITSESRMRLEAALALTRNEHPIAEPGDAWDSNPWVICVENGVVDLRTGDLRPGERDDKITKTIPVFFDPHEICPRWDQFLAEVFRGDEQLIAFIRQAVGYSLSGSVKEQVLFVCHGYGANGKSVFMNVLRQILGDYALNLPFSALELTQRSGVPNDIAGLVGRRLATSSETNEATRLNEARIKSLTGGDPITARFLYCEPFTFEPTAKFWLAMNHLPAVQDDSHGYWRRVRVVPFQQTFDDESADHELPEKLRGELPGILAWAVRGCLEWQRDGLSTPEAVIAATDHYREEADDFRRFLLDCCVVRDDGTETSAELYRRYLGWCDVEGIPQAERLTSKALGSRLTARFQSCKKNGQRAYRGVVIAKGSSDR